MECEVFGVVGFVLVLVIWRFLVVFGGAVFQAVGLSPSAAGFEARSALVGAGYTTSESESIVRHPVTRRVASMLIVAGYFGPGILLALLGVSFVIPTDEDLSDRAVVLAVLVVALLVIDRLGVFRAVGSKPAKALARRMLDNTTFETWIVVGDHAVGELIVPSEETRAAATIAALAAADLQVLAVDRGEPGQTTFPRAGRQADATPGDRVVVFGPRRDLDALPIAT
jgi:hypothetical protein